MTNNKEGQDSLDQLKIVSTQQLKVMGLKSDYECSEFVDNLFDRISAIVRAEVRQQKWTLTTDGLPKEEGRYLIVENYPGNVFLFQFSFKRWNDQYGNPVDHNRVYAWQNLPEKPVFNDKDTKDGEG